MVVLFAILKLPIFNKSENIGNPVLGNMNLEELAVDVWVHRICVGQPRRIAPVR